MSTKKQAPHILPASGLVARTVNRLRQMGKQHELALIYKCGNCFRLGVYFAIRQHPYHRFLAWGGIIALIASSYLLGSKDATKGENNGSD